MKFKVGDKVVCIKVPIFPAGLGLNYKRKLHRLGATYKIKKIFDGYYLVGPVWCFEDGDEGIDKYFISIKESRKYKLKKIYESE